MKHPGPRHRGLCMLCGKASKQSICEHCKSKIQAETLHQKVETEKAGKRH